MSKPDIDLVLDIRSYERVVVIARREGARVYPSAWYRPTTLADMLDLVCHDSVVIVDDVEVTRRTYGGIAQRGPRLLAVTVSSEEHSRGVRKLLLSIQPWCDLHSFNTSIGRVVVAHRFCGQPYDRDRVVDMRGGVAA